VGGIGWIGWTGRDFLQVLDHVRPRRIDAAGHHEQGGRLQRDRHEEERDRPRAAIECGYHDTCGRRDEKPPSEQADVWIRDVASHADDREGIRAAKRVQHGHR
jgi:hypothetical protein